MTSSTLDEKSGIHDASVVIDMLPSGRGGRAGATPGPEWHCRLKIADRFFEARLFGGAGRFSPGVRTDATVKFLDWSLVSRFARPDTPFEVWELRKVAIGRIKSANV